LGLGLRLVSSGIFFWVLLSFFRQHYIYLPEGGKAPDLLVFEMRAAQRSRTISSFLCGSVVGVGRESFRGRVDGGRSGRRGWEVNQPEVRVSGFWVVEAAKPGDDDDGGGGVRVSS
jgi:hypothetical protein